MCFCICGCACLIRHGKTRDNRNKTFQKFEWKLKKTMPHPNGYGNKKYTNDEYMTFCTFCSDER